MGFSIFYPAHYYTLSDCVSAYREKTVVKRYYGRFPRLYKHAPLSGNDFMASLKT
jgi:hypothetical protein